MTGFGTLPTDRRRSLILDLVAKYTYKILSANVRFVGKPVLKITTDNIKKFKGIQIALTALDRSL
jgi:hypothetical protein